MLYSGEELLNIFSVYNRQFWPAHIPASLLLLWTITRWYSPARQRGRLAAALISVFWVWNAVFFLHLTYRTLNGLAIWLADGFLMQALLMTMRGVVLDKMPLITGGRRGGIWWLVAVLFVAPLLQLFIGERLDLVQVAGLFPDQVAAITLVYLCFYCAKNRWYLCALPIAWASYSFFRALQLGVELKLVLPLMMFGIVVHVAARTAAPKVSGLKAA